MGKKTKIQTKKIVRPGRDIVAEKAENLKNKLFKTIGQGINELTLDFSNVKSVDPVGLSVIAATHNTMCIAGAKLIVKNVPDEIDHLFGALGLNTYLDIE
jgi:anti-anti-sigma factor